eukprot:scaffold403088_cov38-Prasinocladus_malaysianus.AAC.2
MPYSDSMKILKVKLKYFEPAKHGLQQIGTLGLLGINAVESPYDFKSKSARGSQQQGIACTATTRDEVSMYGLARSRLIARYPTIGLSCPIKVIGASQSF